MCGTGATESETNRCVQLGVGLSLFLCVDIILTKAQGVNTLSTPLARMAWTSHALYIPSRPYRLRCYAAGGNLDETEEGRRGVAHRDLARQKRHRLR